MKEIIITIPKTNTAFSAIRQVCFASGSSINMLCFSNDRQEILRLTRNRCTAMGRDFNDVISIAP